MFKRIKFASSIEGEGFPGELTSRIGGELFSGAEGLAVCAHSAGGNELEGEAEGGTGRGEGELCGTGRSEAAEMERFEGVGMEGERVRAFAAVGAGAAAAAANPAAQASAASAALAAAGGAAVQAPVQAGNAELLLLENASLLSLIEQQQQSIAALRQAAEKAEREKRSLSNEVGILREALDASTEHVERLEERVACMGGEGGGGAEGERRGGGGGEGEREGERMGEGEGEGEGLGVVVSGGAGRRDGGEEHGEGKEGGEGEREEDGGEQEQEEVGEVEDRVCRSRSFRKGGDSGGGVGLGRMGRMEVGPVHHVSVSRVGSSFCKNSEGMEVVKKECSALTAVNPFNFQPHRPPPPPLKRHAIPEPPAFPSRGTLVHPMARRLLLVAAIIGLVAISVQAAPKPKPKKYDPCIAPLAVCDFYFYNFKEETPVITINAVAAEKVASTALRHKSDKPVQTATTSGASCKVIGGGSCDNYFFFRARGASDAYTKFVNRNDRLGIRPMPQAKIDELNGKCIKLYIETARIKLGKGVNASEWLNPNDNKPGYPQTHRCVVFRVAAGSS
ncbi:unnamed protein product [Closterium sp. Yama58-4]|nr:unnamed protein product [Closterium sp. Yama58-4]